MATIAKTVVATGASSGIGLEAIKQLLGNSQPYKVLLGARNTKATQDACDSFTYDRNTHSVAVLPLELNNFSNVKEFAHQILDKVGQDKIDYLMLNAAISNGSAEPTGPQGSKWCEALIVNHFSQHYLVHLLREKLVTSKARLVFVSSGAILQVKDTSELDTSLLAGSNLDGLAIYPQSKFVAFLGTHWWRRQLQGQCDVLGVSPGLITGTGLHRGSGFVVDPNDPRLKDAKTVPEGARSILAAFTRSDFPADPQQAFLTSWGEWWPKDLYKPSLDENLQNKWCPSLEQIEKKEGILAP